MNRLLLSLTLVYMLSLPATALRGVDGEPSSAQKEATEGNWTGWRGPTRDGLSAESGLQSSWADGGPQLAWKVSGLGSGFSSVAVADGRIYTMGKKGGSTKMIALKAQFKEALSGKLTWEPVPNPNCTPTVDGDRIYGLTHSGELVCVSAKDGKILWQRNFPHRL